jgi:hypothetical protein
VDSDLGNSRQCAITANHIRCIQCSYDLYGKGEHDICPECGVSTVFSFDSYRLFVTGYPQLQILKRALYRQFVSHMMLLVWLVTALRVRTGYQAIIFQLCIAGILLTVSISWLATRRLFSVRRITSSLRKMFTVAESCRCTKWISIDNLVPFSMALAPIPYFYVQVTFVTQCLINPGTIPITFPHEFSPILSIVVIGLAITPFVCYLWFASYIMSMIPAPRVCRLLRLASLLILAWLVLTHVQSQWSMAIAFLLLPIIWSANSCFLYVAVHTIDKVNKRVQCN